jgi:ABC-2 type transport system permease protein
MQLASQVLPMPVAVRLALPSFAFLSWNGLFTSPPMLGPLVTGIVVSLAWAVTATALAYVLFMRRDFTSLANDGSLRRAITFGILPLLGVWVLSAGVVAAATGATGSGIDAGKLQQSLATSFAHIYPVQAEEVNQLHVTAAQLRTSATCQKGGGLEAQNGPGDDWRCTVTWHLPGVNDGAIGQAIYQLDVNANGRYVADGDGPTEVNGYYVVHAPYGDAPNPLWQFDGLVDLLSTTSKG